MKISRIKSLCFLLMESIIILFLVACGGDKATTPDLDPIVDQEDEEVSDQEGNEEENDEVPTQPRFILEVGDYQAVVEAEHSEPLGFALVYDDHSASNSQGVFGMKNAGDGIRSISPRNSKSLFIRYRSNVVGELVVSVNGVDVGSVEFSTTSFDYEALELNVTIEEGDEFILRVQDTLSSEIDESDQNSDPVSSLDDSGLAIDAIVFNSFSYQLNSFVSVRTIYQHSEEFGDSLLFSSDGSVLVSGGLDHESIVLVERSGASSIYLDDLSLPVGMVYDSHGNLYVANCMGGTIGRYDLDGNYSVYTNVDDCPASILIDENDNLIVSSFMGNRVVQVAADGSVTTIVETDELTNPMGLVFDDDKNLYVANWDGGKIFRVDDGVLIEIADFGTRVNQIAYLNGYIYAPLRLENRVDRVHLNGEIETFIGEGQQADDVNVELPELDGPYGIAVSDDGNEMAIVTRNDGHIFILSTNEEILVDQSTIDNLYNEDKVLGERVTLESFDSPQLDASRTVRIYLPPNYDSSEQHYPVIYFQDGQQVFFSDASDENSSWRVDQSLDEQYWLGLNDGVIAVAVDFSASRAQEYIPYEISTDDFTISDSRAAELASFMVDTLKPFIDENYRTLTDRENTYIVGSSFGAFFALYTIFEYPEIYGGVGALSTALWFGLDEQFIADINEKEDVPPIRFFNYASPGDDAGATAIHNVVNQNGFGDSVLYIDDLGSHTPEAWSQAFWNGSLWLLGKQDRFQTDWLEHPTDWYFEQPDVVDGYLTEGSNETVPAGPVTFTFTGEAESVSIIGAWSGWDASAPGAAMEFVDGVWTTTIDLPAGEWAYGVSWNGIWVNPLWSTFVDYFSPQATGLTPGGFGGFDAMLHVVE